MTDLIAIQDTYPEDFAHCFGCGRNNATGYHFKTYEDAARATTEFTPASYHTGGAEYAYGGIIASVIDCHSAGSAAIFWMRENGMRIGTVPSPRFVTARLEVDYVAPTPIGPLQLAGRAQEIGERKVIVTTELRAGGAVTATGQAVMVRVVGD
jgi:acyl-coenzyme A thioesterase PaaI-like protein